MGARTYEANVVVGCKGQGKSPFIVDEIFSSYDWRAQRALALTPTVPKAYHNYPKIENVQSFFERKWRGVFLYYNQEDTDKMLVDVSKLIVQKKLVNGLIVFEDCSGYLNSNMQKAVRQALGNHKNSDVDLLFVTHSLDFVPRFMRKMISNITIFKTNDVYNSPEEIRRLDYPNPNAIYGAWKHVMDAPKTDKWIQPNITIKTGV